MKSQHRADSRAPKTVRPAINPPSEPTWGADAKSLTASSECATVLELCPLVQAQARVTG